MQNIADIRAGQKAQAALDKRTVEHFLFTEAQKAVEAAMLFPTEGRIIMVVGPTGVGKTRLRTAIERNAKKIIASELMGDPGQMPYVSLEVPCPEYGQRFSWNEIFNRYLDGLEVPITPSTGNITPIPRQVVRRGLEHVVLNALQQRRPLAVLLDEANHFASVKSAQVLVDQTNRIKSMITRSGILHVFFGTYELARMAAVSGQLARRSEIIHLSRYRTDRTDHVGHFKDVIKKFQEKLPVCAHMDLAAKSDFLHERSIGCVGVLKSWLVKALSNAIGAGRQEIRLDDLEKTVLPAIQLRQMLDEIVAGERILTESPHQLQLFREELGSVKQPSADPKQSQMDSILESTCVKTEKPPGSKSKPFEPSPARLPAGGAFNGDLGRLAG